MKLRGVGYILLFSQLVFVKSVVGHGQNLQGDWRIEKSNKHCWPITGLVSQEEDDGKVCLDACFTDVAHLLPLLAVGILGELERVVAVTVVTGVIGALLQGLLSDGLRAPVLLVGGLAPFGVRLVKYVSLSLPADITAAVPPGASSATAPRRLEGSATPSAATPTRSHGSPTSWKIAATAASRRGGTGSGRRWSPSTATAATPPHAVAIVVAVIRVIVATSVVVVVVTIVIVIVILITIVIGRIGVGSSSSTATATSRGRHARGRVVVILIIPAQVDTDVTIKHKTHNQSQDRDVILTLRFCWFVSLLDVLFSSYLEALPARSQSPHRRAPSRSSPASPAQHTNTHLIKHWQNVWFNSVHIFQLA